MKPTHTTHDESEGEEEVLETWKVSDKGKISIVANGSESPKTQTGKTESLRSTVQLSSVRSASSLSKKGRSNDQKKMRSKKKSTQNTAPIAPRPCQAAQATSKKPETTPNTTSFWYLGGNNAVKLLTSVDGDLNQQVLSKLAAVPTVVGELALSVEALVSDDITVGGFEDDLLAKITSNTLAAKRALSAQPIPVPVSELGFPLTKAATPEKGSVPNPLANYEPVPNPLARVTPPTSPLSDKRKQTSTIAPKAKRSRVDTIAPMIKAH